MPEKPRKAKKTPVILDSNALFVPIQFKIDIFEELKTLLSTNVEPILLSPVRQELQRLMSEDSAKTRRNASFALRLAEKCKLVEMENAQKASVDDVIVETAHKWECPVFTNDKQLRKKLRDINVPVVYVRQKSRLEIDGRL